jgi:serine protease Do
MPPPDTRLIRLATGAVLGVILAASAASGQQRALAKPEQTDLSTILATTTRAVAPAVVEIFTTSQMASEGLVARSPDVVAPERGSGSGVIVDADGYIVTNAHVVRGARQLRIEVPVTAAGTSILAAHSRTVKGQVVGIDLETDLAVVKIDEHKLPVVPFGDSDELSPGHIVLAMGSPLGFQNSVSLGVVSAVARQLEPESPMIYVQTDAAINPGSSGGPLVDLRGRLVGINTLIASLAGGNEGVGFAAPSNIVRTVYEQIRKFGRVRRGEIGVRAQTITPVLAAGLGLTRDRGAILADVVPGSPAATAGLRPGDVVLSLDGKVMENGRQLHVNLYRRAAGDSAVLEIQRGDQTIKIAVPVAERFNPSAGTSLDPRDTLVPRLGILAVNLDRRIAEMLPQLRVTSGVVVAATVDGARDAREGGLAVADVIYAVNQTRVSEFAHLRDAMSALKSGDSVVLHVERRGELMFVAFTVE